MLSQLVLAVLVSAPLAPEAAVKDLVFQDRAQLGLGPQESLRDVRVKKHKHGSVVKAQRSYKGVPVVGQSIAIKLDDAGQVQRINSDFAPLNIAQEPLVGAVEASLRAISAAYGLPSKESGTLELPVAATQLVIEPHHQTYAYRVIVPGLLPQHTKEVLVSAVDGTVLSARSLAREFDAKAYDPAPLPAQNLAEPSDVTLARVSQDGPGAQLAGEYIDSFSCDTSADGVQVITCRTLTGEVFPGVSFAAACATSFLSEFDQYIVSFCGNKHIIAAHETTGFQTEPQDDLADYTSGPPFDDAFAEVHTYYHLDRMSDFFVALGHTVDLPMFAISNVSMPTPEFIQCAQAGWANISSANKNATSARQVRTTCIIELGDDSFMAFDNAFYLDGSGEGSLPSLLGINQGIYVGQGSTADFAYDGSVLYHELTHGVVAQVQALQSGGLLDAYGTSTAPGALNEAYGDYFSAARSNNPVVGGYVAGRFGVGGGLRDLAQNLSCPDYWVGEVHDDSQGFSAGLWAARALYAQKETATNGLDVRVFDRVVFEALDMLTNESNQDDAAAETLASVKAEPALDDSAGALFSGVFDSRNLFACERVRELTEEAAISDMYVASKGESGGTLSLLGGGQVFTPFAPGPVQMVVDIATAGNGEPLYCAKFQARIANAALSFDNAPDFFGEDAEAPAWDVALVPNADSPVQFSYTQNQAGTTVKVTEGDEMVGLAVVESGASQYLEGILEFPQGAESVYFAVANKTPAALHLADIKISLSDVTCTNIPESPKENITGGKKSGGCNANGTGFPVFSALLALLVLTRAWRRHA